MKKHRTDAAAYAIAAHRSIVATNYATNSEGKNSSNTLSSFFDLASVGINASVSNLWPQFQQDQRLRTSPSLTYSDHSGAISVSPHFSQVVSCSELRMDAIVVTATSLFSFCFFAALRSGDF
jgi:hypothetical protein